MAQQGSERRKFPRSQHGVPIVQDDSAPGLLNHVDNVSANGVLCHTARPVALMTKLRIALELPLGDQHRRVDAQGVVVRCEPDAAVEGSYRVAILFTRLDDADQAALHHYVENDLAQG